LDGERSNRMPSRERWSGTKFDNGGARVAPRCLLTAISRVVGSPMGKSTHWRPWCRR
jgi:hypothetical protein